MTLEGKDNVSIETVVKSRNITRNKFPDFGEKEMLVNKIDEAETVKAEAELSLANRNLVAAINLQSNMSQDIQKHLDNAKEHYYNAISLYNSFIIPYYGLFKVAVLEQNYSEAFLQLQAYDMRLEQDSNFKLIYQMLMILSGQKGYLKDANPNYIQNVKVTYGPILNNYHLAEKSLQNGDYKRVIRHLTVCESLAIKKGIDIDFSTMIQLANTIFFLSKEDQKKTLRAAFSISTDVGKRMLTDHKLLELDATDFESNFLYMDAYIDLKAYTPLIECIEHLKTLSPTKEEKEFLALYERLVSEIIIESTHLKEIYATLRRGANLQQEALYSEAVACYDTANENIPFPYFQVKKAEAYYAMGNLDKAIECCENYLNSGYLHYVEASILLYRIYRDKGDNSTSLSVAFRCYKKSRMQERGTLLHDWLTRLNNGYNTGKDQISPTEKQYVYQGVVKK